MGLFLSSIDTTPVTIYHDPTCPTSREALALIRNAGIEPQVVELLVSPPDRGALRYLLESVKVSPRELLRRSGAFYWEFVTGDPRWSGEDLLELMLVHPSLISSPIVSTAWGVRLCRPSERVLDILPFPQLAPFAKESGEVVIDADRHCVSEVCRESCRSMERGTAWIRAQSEGVG